MACTCFHALAITFGCISLVMMMAAFGTSGWMKGCMSLGNILSSVDTGGVDVGNALGSKVTGMKMCVEQGLVRAAVTSPVTSTSFAISPSSMGGYIYVAAGGLSIAIILCLVAIIMLSVATCGSSGTYEDKNKMGNRTRTAMILLLVAGLLGSVGMIAYSAGSAKTTLHNPMAFMASFGTGAMSAFGQGMGGSNPFSQGMGGGNPLGQGMGGSNPLGQGMGGDNPLGDGNPFGQDTKVPDPFGGSNPLGMGGNAGNTGNIFDNPSRRKRGLADGLGGSVGDMLGKMFAGMDPTYGYSFILGWISVVLIFVTMFLAGMARHYLVQQPYSGNTSSVMRF